MFVARHLMVWALLPWAPAAWAQQGGDDQAQILYAYQTEDTNGLANLIQDLTTRVKEDAGDASLRYHLAHAEYRRGLLAGTARAHEADTAFSDCVDQLKALVAQDVKSVETLVLQSACYAGLADHRKLESVLLRARSDQRLNAALNLPPRNPRSVLLSSSYCLACARRLRVRVRVGARLDIVVPLGVNAHRVRVLVQRFTQSMDRKGAGMQCLAGARGLVPGNVEFALTAEKFAVDWRSGSKRGL